MNWEEYGLKGLQKLVGKTVKEIRMNEENLVFKTDDGDFAYMVEGECCSHSYFHDFYGVRGLLGSKVLSVHEVALSPGDVLTHDDWEDIKVYGFKLVFEGEWGDQTAVFSFRNSSNGYYGGWMYPLEKIPENVPVIEKDTVLV